MTGVAYALESSEAGEAAGVVLTRRGLAEVNERVAAGAREAGRATALATPTRAAVHAGISLAGQNLHAARSAEASAAAACGYGECGRVSRRSDHIGHVTVAVVEACLRVAATAQIGHCSLVASFAIGRGIHETGQADLFAGELVAAVVTTVAAVLLHAANIATRREVVGATFHGHAKRKAKRER